MRKVSTVLMCAVLFLIIACSPQSVAVLPTVAVLPSLSPSDTPTITPLPTFTLVPAAPRIDTEMTAYFKDKSGLSTRLADHLDRYTALSPVKVNPTSIAMIATSQWHQDVQHVYLSLESEIVEEFMPIKDGDTVSNYLSISGDKDALRFYYRYLSDSLPYKTYRRRVPYLLCELRNAGLGNLDVAVVTELKSTKGKDRGSDYICIDPKTISRLNCDDPSRIDVNKLRSSNTCIN